MSASRTTTVRRSAAGLLVTTALVGSLLVADMVGNPPAGAVSLAQTRGPAHRPHHRPVAPPRAPQPVALVPPFPAGTPSVPGDSTALWPIYRITTTQPVVFLTIDDGLVRDPVFLAHLLQAHVPVTIFPTARAVTADPGFFAAMLAAGASLGDHTVTHPVLSTLSPAGQTNEICAAAAAERHLLGVTPVLFRPPYGAMGQATGSAATACGMGHELLWDATVDDGVVTTYHGAVSATNLLVPGDIVLMHFRRTFLQDFDAALAAARRSHLQVAAITGYLQPTQGDPAGRARQDAALLRFPVGRA